MAYVRKTKDYFEIQSTQDDGKTWDCESSNETMWEAKEEKKVYIMNGYYNIRIKKVRVKKES